MAEALTGFHPKFWTEAARIAGNVSELFLALGELTRAVEYAKVGVQLADQDMDVFWRLANLSHQAYALHHEGDLEESGRLFREAEHIQAIHGGLLDWLYSTQGFQYCEHMLDVAEALAAGWISRSWLSRLWIHLLCGLTRSASPNAMALRLFRQARDRALRALPLEEGRLLDIGLDKLIVGRSLFLEAIFVGPRNLDPAAKVVDEALEDLRRAETQDKLAVGLLLRASLRRKLDDLDGAAADLAEASQLARRGAMKLHEADCYLGYAWMELDKGHKEDACRRVEEATKIIQETGYHRRDSELMALRKLVR